MQIVVGPHGMQSPSPSLETEHELRARVGWYGEALEAAGRDRSEVEVALARKSHHASTADAHLRTLTRDFGVRLLDVPTGTPPGGALRRRASTPGISPQSTNLHALAARGSEICGLAGREPLDAIECIRQVASQLHTRRVA